jgi:hypothetical protein
MQCNSCYRGICIRIPDWSVRVPSDIHSHAKSRLGWVTAFAHCNTGNVHIAYVVPRRLRRRWRRRTIDGIVQINPAMLNPCLKVLTQCARCLAAVFNAGSDLRIRSGALSQLRPYHRSNARDMRARHGSSGIPVLTPFRRIVTLAEKGSAQFIRNDGRYIAPGRGHIHPAIAESRERRQIVVPIRGRHSNNMIISGRVMGCSSIIIARAGY